MSIRTMLFALILFMSVPFILLLFWLMGDAGRQAVSATATTSMKLARGLAAAQYVVDVTTRDCLEGISVNRAVRDLDFEACRTLFREQMGATHMYRDILLTDAEGRVLASATRSAPSALQDALAPLFSSSLSPSLALSPEIEIAPADFNDYPSPVVPYVMGLAPDEKGQFRYALMVLVDSAFYADIVETIDLPENSALSLIDRNGTYFFRSFPDAAGTRSLDDKIDDRLASGIKEGGVQGTIVLPAADGGVRLAAYVKLFSDADELPYATVIAEYEETDTLNTVKDAAALGIVVLLCVIAVVVAAALFLGTRYLALPLEKFLQATRRFADGELDARSRVDYHLGEIGLIAKAFDDMADVLQQKNARQHAFEAELTRSASRLEDLVKRRTEDLDRAQKHIRLVLDSTSEGIIELDTHGCVIFFNRASLSILGYDATDVLSGMMFCRLVMHGDGDSCMGEDCRVGQALTAPKSGRVSGLGLLKKDGGVVPVDLFVSPVMQGDVRTGSVLTFVDLSDSLEKHEMMSAIYNTTSNGYITISDTFEVLDCNPAMLDLLCLREEDKPGVLANFLSYSPVYQPDGSPSSEKHLAMLREALEKGSARFDWALLDSAGEFVPCSVTMTSIHVNHKRLFVGSVQDMRDQIRARNALNRQRDQLQKILDSCPIALGIVSDGVFRMINRNGTELLGINAGDMAEQIYADLTDRKRLYDYVGRGVYLEGWEVRLRDVAGRFYETLLTVKPFVYENRDALLVWIVDVTELAHARMAAEEAARAKSDFLASMSHEIRTPMNAILGMSHLCLQTRMTEKQLNYLQKIQGAATALLSLINDILDFSKIEAGKLVPENVSFRFSETMRSLWDLVAFKAEEKGILFSLGIEEDVPDCVYGDPLRLNQILINLCNNAIKFTERGSIVVNVHSGVFFEDGEGNRKVRLCFTVSDTGIGMTPDLVARLFSPFTQADGSITRRYGGSGLGLSICKHLVEAMNGTIDVESEYGEGTRVRFFVELGLGEEPRESSVVFEMQGCHVLVIDDEETARMVLREELVSLDLRVDTAASGEEGLEKIRFALDERDPYTFVLLDWKMPSSSGQEILKKIYSSFEAKERPHVVVVSAQDYDECLAACAKLGVEKFLPKPVSRSDLYDALIGILTQERRTRDNEAAPTQTLSYRQKVRGDVLLVEDNAVNQEIAVELLERSGAKVDVAGNGAEAVEAVKVKRYDLILMDVQMPLMDGLEATRHIRLLNNCGTNELPIIAMTAHAMKGDYEKSLAAGMNDHITKPIDPEQLYRTLYKWLDVVSIEEIPATPASNDLLPDVAFLDAVPGLDAQQGLLHTDENVELYLSLLRRFPAQNAQLPERIRLCVSSGKIDEAQRLAHTMKGLCGTLGMTELGEAARRLEAALRPGWDAKEAVADFAVRLAAMIAALEAAFGSAGPSPQPEAADWSANAGLEKPDSKKLKLTVIKLPELLREDLMKAWGEAKSIAVFLAGTSFAAEAEALVSAVRDCDEVAVENLGRALLRAMETRGGMGAE